MVKPVWLRTRSLVLCRFKSDQSYTEGVCPSLAQGRRFKPSAVKTVVGSNPTTPTFRNTFIPVVPTIVYEVGTGSP